MKTIELRNLSIGYNERRSQKVVGSNLNAEVLSGELTCLLGANGVGKSTLLRTLTANQSPLGGEILYGGRDHRDYSARELSALISIVLTERVEIRNMGVEELVGMGRAPHTGFWGTLSKEDQRVVEESIEMVGISHLARRMVHTLSDGERQKVMIAKALAQQTPIILLDEPTAFLDFPSKVEMMQLLHTLSRRTQKTIFLSTHDLELALQIADRVWLMDREHGLRMGVPEDLSLDGSLSRFFERKGIIFDRDSGLFRVECEQLRTIRMTGHGHRFAMIRKALLRNGINATSFAEVSDVEINVGKESFEVLIEDQRYEVQSVEQLLKLVVR